MSEFANQILGMHDPNALSVGFPEVEYVLDT